MNAINNSCLHVLITRQSNLALSKYVADAIKWLKQQNMIFYFGNFRIGQSDTEIMDHSDVSL
jgi:methylmalonyl-CoA mutase